MHDGSATWNESIYLYGGVQRLLQISDVNYAIHCNLVNIIQNIMTTISARAEFASFIRR